MAEYVKIMDYKYSDVTVQEIIHVTTQYKDLKPVMDSYVFNDGSSRELMNLTGTVPIRYNGKSNRINAQKFVTWLDKYATVDTTVRLVVQILSLTEEAQSVWEILVQMRCDLHIEKSQKNTYHIPICVWLLDTFPFNPPFCFVKPTSTMMIKAGKHVDANGKVYLPYLQKWEHPQSDLLGLIQMMILVFGEEPPVFSRPITAPHQPFQPTTPANQAFYPFPGNVRQTAARDSLAAALPSSFESNEVQSLGEPLLPKILETFILNRESGSTPVVVRRNNVLKDTVAHCKKSYFSWKRTPHVEFVGEEAADYGGPRREFFRLLMIDVVSSYGIFEGPQDRVLFTYNLSALEEGKYRTAGMLIAWSVLHNGPGICALHPTLFQIMCSQNADLQYFDYHDFPNEKVRSNLQKIQQCSTEEQLVSLCSDLGDWISECGVPGIFIAKIKDIPTIFAQVVKHFIYFRTVSVIQQFIEGINTHGNLWHQVEKNWKAFLPIFTSTSGEISLSTVKGLYEISWSPQGSNRRRREEETMFGWDMFLIAIQEKAVDVTFKDLLIFWTGVDSVPSLGFPRKPVIEFYEQEESSRLPYASTCSLSLFLPRGVGEEKVEALLNMAIKESFGFGKV